MSKELDKHIENLVDNIMSDAQLESPSKDFTENIMLKVATLEMDKPIEYKPLISKPIWFMLFAIIVIICFIIINVDLKSSKWMNLIDMEFNNLLPKITLSETTLYATIILSVLFFMQIIFLKNYFNKRLAL